MRVRYGKCAIVLLGTRRRISLGYRRYNVNVKEILRRRFRCTVKDRKLRDYDLDTERSGHQGWLYIYTVRTYRLVMPSW